jgi:hypothetical protein
MSTLRLLKYHDSTHQNFPPNYMRAGAHADFDVLTLLFQREGQDGLEVCPVGRFRPSLGTGTSGRPSRCRGGRSSSMSEISSCGGRMIDSRGEFGRPAGFRPLPRLSNATLD